jgi:hypothetical protein
MRHQYFRLPRTPISRLSDEELDARIAFLAAQLGWVRAAPGQELQPDSSIAARFPVEQRAPEPMEQPAPEPMDPDALLAELLAYCRRAAQECLTVRDDSFLEFDPANGARLFQMTLDIIAAMKRAKAESNDSIRLDPVAQKPDPAATGGRE